MICSRSRWFQKIILVFYNLLTLVFWVLNSSSRLLLANIFGPALGSYETSSVRQSVQSVSFLRFFASSYSLMSAQKWQSPISKKISRCWNLGIDISYSQIDISYSQKTTFTHFTWDYVFKTLLPSFSSINFFLANNFDGLSLKCSYQTTTPNFLNIFFITWGKGKFKCEITAVK